MQIQTLFTLLPALAALPAINAYFILSHPILETTRLDPIVNPGEVGGHVHSIVGGNNFDKEMTYESALASTCTTAPITVDKSNYWTPQLYYYNPADASYQAIPVSNVNTYYLPRYSPGETTVRAFPDGLRMLSGDPNRRTYTKGDPESEAISYVCLDYSGQHSNDPAWAQRNSFFQHNCPQGMRAQVNFPSCWDGVNLDSDDHQSHMAWPSGGVDGGSCPSTHPVRLVSLFYEFIYNVQNFPFNDVSQPTWVFSNGDTTGYGMHGDFLNGWPSYNNGTNVLQQALDQCNQDNGVGGVLSACPPFVPYIDSASANACRPLNDQVDEDVGFGHSISSLPGDNEIWIGNSTIKPLKPGYNDTASYTDFKSVIPSGFTEVGCIAEASSGRALTGASFSNKNMTRGACVSWCADRGYPLAGVEYGQECYCDFAMRNGASNTTLLDPSKCSMACANNTNENCGGSATLNLWNNPSLYPVAQLPTGWSSYGCMTEGNGVRALSGYSTASGSMTQDICMKTCQAKGFTYAGIEYASECYCGNSFNAGSVPASSGCSMACSGNSLQTCGGGNRLTTFTFSNGTTTPSASSAAVSSSTSSRASSASSAAASSTSSAAASSVNVAAKVAASSAPASSSSSSSSASASVSQPVSKSSTFTVKAVSSSKAVSASPSSTIKSYSSTFVKSTSTIKASSAASPSAAASSSSASSSVVASSSSSASKAASSSSSAAASSSSAAAISSSSAAASKAASSSAAAISSSLAAASSSSSKAVSSTSSVASSTSAAVVSTSTSKAASSVVASSTSSSAAAASSSAAASYAPAYLGCFNDYNPRHLNGSYYANSQTMTNDVCTAYCKGKGFQFAGTEYSQECFCGNYLNQVAQVADSKCSTPCRGNNAQKCGGGMLLSVYQTGLNTGVKYNSTSATGPTRRSFSAKWRS